MRSGELFAGVGGLGMAVDEVFGSAPGWFCEFDAAPSKVLGHHFPGVPNFGDVREVKWTPGCPTCGEATGLIWRRDELFGPVRKGYHCPEHGWWPLDIRFADPDADRIPEPVDVLVGGFPCQDVSLAGARRGMKDGTRSGLWSEYAKAIENIRPDWVVIENVRGLISARADSEVEPCTWCVGDGDDEYHLRALDAVLADLSRLGFDAEWTPIRASEVGAPHGRYRFFILAWPATYTTGLGRNGRTEEPRRGDVLRADAGDSPTSTLSLLPTPGAYDGERGGSQHPDKRRVGGHSITLQDVTEHLALLPTPPVADAVAPGTDWGPYTAAVSGWEAVLGRPAPSPVRMDGRAGNARLNPELTEWMMGWPAGWVTAPEIGLTRAEQLKACGNGVVPQQATAALRHLLSRPGVPALGSGAVA